MSYDRIENIKLNQWYGTHQSAKYKNKYVGAGELGSVGMDVYCEKNNLETDFDYYEWKLVKYNSKTKEFEVHEKICTSNPVFEFYDDNDNVVNSWGNVNEKTFVLNGYIEHNSEEDIFVVEDIK